LKARPDGTWWPSTTAPTTFTAVIRCSRRVTCTLHALCLLHTPLRLPYKPCPRMAHISTHSSTHSPHHPLALVPSPPTVHQGVPISSRVAVAGESQTEALVRLLMLETRAAVLYMETAWCDSYIHHPWSIDSPPPDPYTHHLLIHMLTITGPYAYPLLAAANSPPAGPCYSPLAGPYMQVQCTCDGCGAWRPSDTSTGTLQRCVRRPRCTHDQP
jgi:hypothetical protein